MVGAKEAEQHPFLGRGVSRDLGLDLVNFVLVQRMPSTRYGRWGARRMRFALFPTLGANSI